MKREISKHVGDNEETRQELEGKREWNIEPVQENEIKE